MILQDQTGPGVPHDEDRTGDEGARSTRAIVPFMSALRGADELHPLAGLVAAMQMVPTPGNQAAPVLDQDEGEKGDQQREGRP